MIRITVHLVAHPAFRSSRHTLVLLRMPGFRRGLVNVIDSQPLAADIHIPADLSATLHQKIFALIRRVEAQIPPVLMNRLQNIMAFGQCFRVPDSEHIPFNGIEVRRRAAFIVPAAVIHQRRCAPEVAFPDFGRADFRVVKVHEPQHMTEFMTEHADARETEFAVLAPAEFRAHGIPVYLFPIDCQAYTRLFQ